MLETFNECSQHQSQFTNPDTFLDTQWHCNCDFTSFQYIKCVNISFSCISHFAQLSFGCNLVLAFSLDLRIQIFCNLHPESWAEILTRQDLVKEMMPGSIEVYTINVCKGRMKWCCNWNRKMPLAEYPFPSLII